MKKIVVFLVLLSPFGCIEPIDFSIKNPKSGIVIESHISNVSFQESLSFPSDGRYFEVTLRSFRDVDDRVKDSLISGAEITLLNDLNETWSYTALEDVPGKYFLPFDNFKAVGERLYKLQVIINEDVYESWWEKLPMAKDYPVGEISFIEVDQTIITYPADTKVIDDIKGVEVYTSIPENNNDEIYYRWDFTPMWHYRAPLAVGGWEAYENCWIVNDFYLSDFNIHVDRIGGYDKELFFLPVEGNDRIFEQFSVLISQQMLSHEYYQYWKSLQDQQKTSGIFNTPPSNLPSNYTCINDPSKEVVGYFGVVNESSKRWYFNKDDLSYNVINTLRDDCLVVYGRPEAPDPPAPQCYFCLSYDKGEASLVRPLWWEEN